MASLETIERVSNVLALQSEGQMPTILCRRYLPHRKNTSLRWDAGWEGLRRNSRAGGAKWEIYHDFQLRIEIDGLCMIPDTPNNRRKLEKMEKPRVARIEGKDPVTGVPLAQPRVVTKPPLYQRVEGTLMERGLVDRLYEVFKQRMAAEGKDVPFDPDAQLDPEDDGIPQEPDPVESIEPAPDPRLQEALARAEALEARLAALEAAKPAPKAKGKPGRKPKPDPLLAPIRPAGGDV